MTTPTLEIKRRLDSELAKIRGYGDLTGEAKRRMISEAYEKAQAEYRETIETQEREIAERVGKAERAVFEARYPSTAMDEDKVAIRAARRAAYDAVYNTYRSASSERPQQAHEELERLLERAERTGDPELSTAVYHVATERGLREVADSYLETRPEERKRWEGYVAARTEADSLERTLGHAMGFGLMKPPELEADFGGSPAAMRG